MKPMHGPTHWEKESKKDDSLEEGDKATKFLAIIVVIALVGGLLLFFSLSLSNTTTQPVPQDDLQIGASITPTINVNVQGEEQGNFEFPPTTGIPTLVASPTPKPTNTRVPTNTMTPTQTPSPQSTESPTQTPPETSTLSPTPTV
jgi:hypothetical protein